MQRVYPPDARAVKSCDAVFNLKMVIVHTKISTGVMDELITTLPS